MQKKRVGVRFFKAMVICILLLGIICVVGDLDWSNVGFETLAAEAMKNIPVRMISYGGSNYNISFLVRECDKKRALQSLSDTLFNGNIEK